MVRVRFAPSPTGELHLGSARTALYNYLFAKKNDGKFIIRLEDTDQERSVEGSLKRMLEGLTWLGLTWDEGPDIGGPYVPYIQSERLPIYKKQADELINRGGAYYCFCSAQRLEVLRRVQEAEKQITKYDRACLNLKPEEIKAKLEAKLPYIVRLKIPAGQTIFNDLIRGQIKVDNTSLDDSVLLKSDGFPTYHLANVVDDHLMEITHVIRGEEWLPSTPKHLLIYQGFGWSTPEFAHLPNVLNEKKTKLSKRKDGEAVWVQTYQAQGYLPEALLNYLVLLGWNPGTEKEIFTLEELIDEFDLSHIQKGGAIFDEKKLRWVNREHMKLNTQETEKIIHDKITTRYPGLEIKTELVEIIAERIETFRDVDELIEAGELDYFFNEPVLNTSKLPWKNESAKETVVHLKRAVQILKEEGDLMAYATEVGKGSVLWPVRFALSGKEKSPDPFKLIDILGREKAILRIEKAINLLDK